MNILAYLSIIISFAIGYIAGVVTSRLIKIAVAVVGLAAIVVALYFYFLR